LFADLADATEDDVLDQNWIRAGAIKQRVYNSRAQVNGMDTRKATSPASAGSAGC